VDAAVGSGDACEGYSFVDSDVEKLNMADWSLYSKVGSIHFACLNGNILAIAREVTSATGTAPYVLESFEFLRLSPCSHTCPCGTRINFVSCVIGLRVTIMSPGCVKEERRGEERRGEERRGEERRGEEMGIVG
jgi:hypothetical protein